MVNFTALLRKENPTKQQSNAVKKHYGIQSFSPALLLGGAKFRLLVGLLCFSLSTYAQTEIGSSSHIEGTKAVELTGNLGQNHKGAGLGLYYYPRDNMHIKIFGVYRKFNYKSYSENISEVGLEFGLTLLEGSPRDRNDFFGLFNITPFVGASIEVVKVTSTTQLIKEYPKHTFVYGGVALEYAVSEKIGLNLFFREFYAINGSEDKLGNWRYDYGVGLRYYIFQ